MAAGDPASPVLFEELTPGQAHEHLDVYLAEMSGRIARLRIDVAARGGPSAAECDGTPGSLERLWTWWRTVGAVQHDGPEWTPDDPDLPIWLPHVRPALYRGWSAGMLRDLDRIAAYAGEVILAADHTARWVVGQPPLGAHGQWHGFQEPVVVSRRVGRRNPRAAFTTMLRRELDPTTDPLLRRARVRLLLPPEAWDSSVLPEDAERPWKADAVPITVGPSWQPQFDLVVEISEMARAVVGPEVFEHVAARLASYEGVDEVIHPDSEEFHLRTGMRGDQVERIVRDALGASMGSPSGDRARQARRGAPRAGADALPRGGTAGEQTLARLLHRDNGREQVRRVPVRDPADPEGAVLRVLDVLDAATLEAAEAKVGRYPDAHQVVRQVDRDRVLTGAGILAETQWHFYTRVGLPDVEIGPDLPGQPAPPSRLHGVASRPFGQLALAEAQRHLDAYTAQIPRLVAEFRDDVAGRGGPSVTDLDGSPRSLDAVWAWLVRRFPRDDGPWSPDDPDLPLWLPHLPRKRHDRWPTSLLRDLDGCAAYAATVILAADGTARWAVSVPPPGLKTPFLWHHEPVIASRRVGERNPRHQIGVFLARAQWLAAPREPERLRLLLPDGVAHDPPVRPATAVAGAGVDDLEVVVGPAWEPPYTHTVWVDESAGLVVGDRVLDALEAAVAAAHHVQDAAHVDREVLHVRTGLGRAQVEQIVRDALRG